MKNKQAKQMIQDTQGVLFLYEQRVKSGFRGLKSVMKNDNKAFTKAVSYGYRF